MFGRPDDELIISAIEQRLTITFRYHGEHRRVEPHTFGRDGKGHKALSAYQVNKGWRLFHVAEMREVQTGAPFSGTRPGYVRGDSRMDTIYVQL